MNVLSAFGNPRGVVAIVGAGGKTTLLYRLALEGRAAGLRVLMTSTTHMGAPREGPAFFEEDEDRTDVIRAALLSHGQAMVLGRRVRDDKCQGLVPARVDALAVLADLVLVEADGARQRSFKLPADHEPVVPTSTRLVVVVAGLDVLGQPLDDAHVHRLDRVLVATGQRAGSAITAETVVAALTYGDGYPARVPNGAQSAVFLNKVRDGARDTAAWIGERLVPPYDVVVVGSARAGAAERREPSP